MSPLLGQLKRGVNHFLERHGYHLVRLASLDQDHLDLTTALSRLSATTPVESIQTIIDIGASNGCWSEQVMAFLPYAEYLLVEANSAHEPQLASFTARHSNADYIIAAASDKTGELNFDASDLFGGLATHLSFDEFTHFSFQSPAVVDRTAFIRVPAITLDDIVRQRCLKPPYFLKLDVHGFELPILAGAGQTLTQTRLLQVECYNFQLTRDAVRFPHLITYLESRGFRVIDLCNPMHRPGDHAFWQVDFFFIPSSSAQFQVNHFAGGSR